MKMRYTLKQLGSRRAGFTLVEVMLVVVILGILATVAVVATKGKTKKASISATRTTIKSIGTALDAFEVDMGVYPGSLQELITSSGSTSWQGPYLQGKQIPTDAWGNPVQYSKSGDDYELKSGGPDGSVGGSDDITN